MNPVKDIFNQIHLRVFNSIVHNRLVYNSCWEDPRIDRQLLALDETSNVVMLTSAGCNALDYLLDEPASIHCVDINSAQNALLELKLALFKNGNHALLWQMFGQGSYGKANTIYNQKLRSYLSNPSQHFWDHHIDYFVASGSAQSFYFKGTSGTVAKVIYKRLKHKGLTGEVLNLINASSLDEQKYYFEEIEPYLWNAFSRWLLKRDTTMSLLGVPREQRAMIENETKGGLASFIQQSLCEVFTQKPIRDNYFWRVYLTGSYSQECCPNYLKKKNFTSLRANIDRIKHRTCSLVDFLKTNPGSYSHFILLDHQDWMAYHQPEKLAAEWKFILANAKAGAKILFRSAGKGRSFLPKFIHSHVSFSDNKTQELHQQDRVGTYGSTHLAIVK